VRSTVFAILALSTAALFACGGSQPAANPPPGAEAPADASAPGFTNPAPNGDGGAGPTASDKPGPTAPTVKDAEGPHFDSLSKDKKVEVMMTKVVPNVGKAFKDFDGKRYEKFGCATCHGPQKKEDPHKVLPKLTLSNGGFEKLSKTKPEIMKFMGEKVVPQMAAALGEKPFDPATHQGFGCAGCHAIDRN
jgi:hypothetical protein